MPEVTARNIRIPVPGEEGKHQGHKIRTINISKSKGIKALYCGTCKKIITYLFARNKGWDMPKAKEWVSEHTKSLVEIREIAVDQEKEFLKLSVAYKDGETKLYEPNSPSFILGEGKDLSEEDEDMTEAEKQRGQGQGTGGARQGDGGASKCVCPKCGHEVAHEKGKPCSNIACPKCGATMVGKVKKTEEAVDIKDGSLEIIKVDKEKHLVYGVFLVPEKPDHDGDVISADDIEKVAHGFMADYRTIDEMHKEVIKADIVESGIAWAENLDFHGKALVKGTWFGAVKVHDQEVWEKIQSGEYKGFSVRISGVREPIGEGAE